MDFVVREANGRGIGGRAGVVVAIEASPVDGGQAHRTGLATGEEFAACQVERAQVRAGVADGDDLGMRGRVVRDDDVVVAAADDLPVLHDHAAEGTAMVGIDSGPGLGDGGEHEGGGARS